ncbi:unnamed protein product [Phytophthora fragariaefolia]|uniref:Unnamed protein product n=1 Tax=Phytophthora fragariaefolia TaxID=1490495 RepID=A0A9W6U1E0_9STRA|nr:unnamed protein product [Phytophthora fragariaefolia]
MTQRKSESPLEFYYRLNKVADKAGIDFASSPDVPDEPTSFKTKTIRTKSKMTGMYVSRMWWRKFPMCHRQPAPPRGVPNLEMILERMEAKYKPSQVPSSRSSRAPDEGRLRMESFDQRPYHPVSKTGIAPSSVNAAMISDILKRAVAMTSSVIAAAAKDTPLVCVEFDLVSSVTSFMKLNVENGRCSKCPLDGDPERVGLKTTPKWCVLVYVGPEMRNKNQENHPCMTVPSEKDDKYLSVHQWLEKPRLVERSPKNNDWDDPPEFRLSPGQDTGLGTGFTSAVLDCVPSSRNALLWRLSHSERELTSRTWRVSRHPDRLWQSNPQRDVVWAGRGDRWATQIIYATRSWPVAVKVVNISDKTVWIDSTTAVARIVGFRFFPKPERFVRPGLREYKEWQVMIYDNTAQSDRRSEDGPLWTCTTSCLKGGRGVAKRGTRTLGFWHSRKPGGGRDDGRHCQQRAEPPEAQSRSSTQRSAAPSC